ncbi:hypothetical protein E3P99_00942 [Wallemia hederae]|uniref:Transcription activator GCR1-like domain-containing protein n=1 Tax=Wallemia hederae TaxID=1540922 RepID=A0A4T0FUL0_9BASI|nr:hypothetical protein E3P99_00942 [Wallemia hederae]
MSINDQVNDQFQALWGEIASLQLEVKRMHEEMAELKRGQHSGSRRTPESNAEPAAAAATTSVYATAFEDMNQLETAPESEPEPSTSAIAMQDPHSQFDEDSLDRLRQLLEPPKATLKPTNDTVIELYEEYERGLNGNPSIKALESAFGITWRSAPATNMAYSRRLVVIREIEKRARAYAHLDGKRDADVDDHYTLKVINELEDERRTTKLSMHAFIQQLKSNACADGAKKKTRKSRPRTAAVNGSSDGHTKKMRV